MCVMRRPRISVPATQAAVAAPEPPPAPTEPEQQEQADEAARQVRRRRGIVTQILMANDNRPGLSNPTEGSVTRRLLG